VIIQIAQRKENFLRFISRLEKMSKGEEFPFSLTLRDPLGNSFITARLGSVIPPEMDPQLTLLDFERSW
jgi:C4-type Zn-finger protein